MQYKVLAKILAVPAYILNTGEIQCASPVFESGGIFVIFFKLQGQNGKIRKTLIPASHF